MVTRARALRLVGKSTLLILLSLAWIWGTLALYFSFPAASGIRLLVAVVFATSLPACLVLTRMDYRGLTLCLGMFGIVLYWWQNIEPLGNKEWAPDVAQVAHGDIEDGSFTEQWETRRYNLADIRGLDLFLSYWGSPNVAHAILSWDFGEDQYLAISIETRKDIHQEYSAIKGFFKQFELSYVAADEEDVIRLRTDIRGERVYGYRLSVTGERARALLENYLAEMNRLTGEPEFYNALTRNCTTTIRLHNKAIDPDTLPPPDWRIIASGYLDELLYERGALDTSLPFSELRSRSRIAEWKQIEEGRAYFRQPSTED